jgi:hypothetical protein
MLLLGSGITIKLCERNHFLCHAKMSVVNRTEIARGFNEAM